MRMQLLPVIALAAGLAAAPSSAANAPLTRDPCTPTAIGFDASGTLVAQALTRTARNRYSGTLTVEVERASHRAPTGTQTYTLDNDRVRFDGLAAAGDRVTLHGAITRRHKGCASAPTVDVRRVGFKAAS